MSQLCPSLSKELVPSNYLEQCLLIAGHVYRTKGGIDHSVNLILEAHTKVHLLVKMINIYGVLFYKRYSPSIASSIVGTIS